MSVTVKLTGWEELVKQLERIDTQITQRVAREAVREAAQVVAARAYELCPVGDPDHQPDKKPLRDTIGIELRDYDSRQLAVVGPQYPAGAHGHLVEFGHALIVHGQPAGHVQGHPFLRPAFDETEAAQRAAMEQVIQKALADLT